jgi:hypothetical protein
MFEGTIPEIRTHSELQWILIDDNLFEGTFPSTLYSQLNLEKLEFSNNLISGTIAPTVVALENLYIFHGDGNQISGTIPTQFGLLEDLEELHLHGNRLTGTIPTQLGVLAKLVQLDLSSNRLTGSLPESIGDLEKFAFLNVAWNGLTGDVPSSFLELDSLNQFFLQDNNITDGLQAFCNRSLLTTEIEADCGGDDPQIDCDCCTECCEGEVCSLSVPSICMIKSGGLEMADTRGAVCTCSDDGTDLSCTDTACESCNLDGSVCVVNTNYGYTFNETTGDIESFRNDLKYVRGRSDTITYIRDFDKDSCEVEYNGEKCRYCDIFVCGGSGFQGFQVSCDNFEGGFSMDSCIIDENPGYLEVFYFVDASLRSGCAPILFNLDA